MSKDQKIIKPDKVRERLVNNSGEIVDAKAEQFFKSLFRNKSYFRRWLWLILIVLGFDIVESFLSGSTSFAFVYDMAFIFLSEKFASVAAWVVIILFEGAVILLGYRIWLEIFNKETPTPKGLLFLMICLVMPARIWVSIYGAEPMVKNYSKPPVMVQADEMEEHLKKQIAEIDKGIKHLQDHDDKAFTRVTAKDINALNEKKEKYNDQLLALHGNRLEDNKNIKMDRTETLIITQKQIKGFIWVGSLLSFFLFNMLLARFSVFSARWFEEKKAEIAETEKAEIEIISSNGNDGGNRKSDKSEIEKEKSNSRKGNSNISRNEAETESGYFQKFLSNNSGNENSNISIPEIEKFIDALKIEMDNSKTDKIYYKELEKIRKDCQVRKSKILNPGGGNGKPETHRNKISSYIKAFEKSKIKTLNSGFNLNNLI